MWCWQVFVFHWLLVRDFSSLLYGPLDRASHNMAAYLIQSKISKRESQHPNCNLVYVHLRSELPSFLLYAIVHIGQSWYNVGGDYTRVWLPGGRQHQGSSRRYATTSPNLQEAYKKAVLANHKNG